VQKGLTLSRTTHQVSCYAIFSELADMAAHVFPTPYLTMIVFVASTQKVPTVPLEPAPRIIFVNPSPFSPICEWFGGFHAKKIKRRIASFGAQLCFPEPALWKLISAICHVVTAENTHFKHLTR
jgi:hypothetical protein